MFTYVPGLFYAPRSTWQRIHDSVEHSPYGFIPVLLIGSLIPALCVYYGSSVAGWALFGSEKRHFLSSTSASLLAVAVWLAFVTNAIVMGYIVRWVLFRTPFRPSALHGIAFATFLSVPFMLAGLAALYPERWLVLLVLPIAAAFSALQLYFGLPHFMRLHQDKAYFYGACIIGAGMLAIVSIGVFYLESWRAVSPPGEYQGIEEQRDQQRLP
ncbi:Yip1 family protein [Halopseudomonas xiamenensis]|uniref:Yip1 family protein n=1 Tax=Halopseudomonas xiamenensis TaxID=157792 RepID=UPI001627BF98|nr:Yip1 family protein [Halopseudomonas xiamenensis]